MIIISHRGNLDGPNPSKENTPDQIMAAISAGFFVEIDLWAEFITSSLTWLLWLGHDGPQFAISPQFLLKDNLFIHCKNVRAVQHCRLQNIKNFFFHNIDDVTLTSSNYIWTYPRKEIPLIPFLSIPVIVDRDPIWDLRDIKNCHGICTDYPNYYKDLLNV